MYSALWEYMVWGWRKWSVWNVVNDLTGHLGHVWDFGCSPISDKIYVINLLFLAAHCGRLWLCRELRMVSIWRKCRRESRGITFILLLPDDSWYSGLALSFGIRSKALTVKEIWQFKVFQRLLPENIVIFGFGQTDDLGWLALRCCPATTQFQASREAQ